MFENIFPGFQVIFPQKKKDVTLLQQSKQWFYLEYMQR